MERQYIQVRPSRERLNPDDIVSHISSLHKLTRHGQTKSIRSRLNPLEDSSERVPEFEFLAISQGKDSPVEFLYGTEEKHLNALRNRLTTAYPASFDVEIVEIDVLEKIIPPEKYAPDDFVKKLENGHLLFDPDTKGTPDDIEGNVVGETPTEQTNTTDTNTVEETTDTTQTDTNSEKAAQSDGGSPEVNTDALSLEVDRASDTTEPKEPEDAVTATGNSETISPEQIDGYDMLQELDAGLLDLVDLPDTLDANYLEADIDGPTWTEDGEILARPTLEHGIPVAARWDGDGERKKDWMTTMKMFSKVASPGDEDVQDRAPLATLIQHLAASDLPIAFQVVFKRIEDWSRQAERRKDNLHLNRDTMGQKVMYELGEILHSPSKERRRERMRDYMEDIGESADQNAESPIAGDVGKRRKLIDNKIPKRTFRANLRAVSVANDDVPVADVERTMDDLASVLDHLDGYFYGLNPTILHDDDGKYRNKKEATEEFHRLVNREIVTGSGKTRPDIVVNADELANFITVPSSENLTVEGVRGTRAEAESRDPLPKPDADLMREFHSPGMRVGYALDKEADTEPVPTQVPPKLLTTHYGRFATTGAGKSKALINDILSLHENTDGPTILVDPKGDGMTENYMKSHFERFGEENFKEKVIHFPVPEILPGFSFFNIQSEVDQRYDESSNRTREDIRGDVIQNKADHYQELLKLVMGVDSYNDSKVAPILISSFIKILYDEEYVKDKQRKHERGEVDDFEGLNDRPDKNFFTHHQLEQFARKVKKGKTPQPVSDKNKPIKDTIQEQIEGDEHTFAVIMNSVFNRLNYIREDQHLRRMFNNSEPRFDFRDHLDDNKVILFDLGDLRDDATLVMTGMILTEMWDSVSSADQKTCTQNHDSIIQCREKARENGLDAGNPQCREPWPDDHVVNLVLDEAASVTTAGVMTRMLEQGRSFHLSVGLSMQFPEQMKDASDRVYKNVLNNVATKIIGKITLDEEIAKAMAHEGMDVDDFNNRISALPRGEWIAQLPSPQFMETGPEPFSLQPLPIPAGHPESRRVLTSEAEQRFNHFMKNQVHHRAQHNYGVKRESHSNTTDETVDTTNLQGTESGSETTATTDTTDSNSQTTEDVDETAMGDVDLPSDVLNEDFNDSTTTPDTNDTPDTTTSGTDQQDTSDKTTGTGNNSSPQTVGLSSENNDGASASNAPPHVNWDSVAEVYTCLVCGEEYFANEKTDAAECCTDTINELKDELGDPSAIQSVMETDTDESFIQSTEHYLDHRNEIRKYSTVAAENEITFTGETTPSVDPTIEITREKDLTKVINEFDAVTIAAVCSAFVAEIPPEYQDFKEKVINWYISILSDKQDAGVISDELPLTEDGIQELIFETPPADVSINAREFITTFKDVDPDAVLDRWKNNDCDPAFKRFYTGTMPVTGTRLTRPGKYGAAYSPTLGLHERVTADHTTPVFHGLPSETTPTEETDTTTRTVERVETPDITKSHLDEYDITRDEVAFLKSVVKAMNNDLDGYNLRDSMASEIKSLYDIDEDKLKDHGYIKRHVASNYRIYYTVTPAGQEACRATKEHGFMIGDLGSDTPHRVGIELVKQYYNSMPDVQRVELSPKENGSEHDIVAYNADGDRIAIVEVEAGRVTADTAGEQEGSTLNDYEEIRRDYTDLKESDGASVWVVRNNEVAGAVLRALKSGDSDTCPFDIPIEDIEAVENTDMTINSLNEKITEINDPGVGEFMTYKQLRNKLSTIEAE